MNECVSDSLSGCLLMYPDLLYIHEDMPPKVPPTVPSATFSFLNMHFFFPNMLWFTCLCDSESDISPDSVVSVRRELCKITIDCFYSKGFESVQGYLVGFLVHH